MSEPLAYLNGEFMPLAEARVPIEDRGYQFADGVYELITAHEGRLFLLGEHLRRLERSAEGIRLQLPFTRDEIAAICTQGMEECGIRDAVVYIQVTRGCASRSHEISRDLPPQLTVTFQNSRPNDPAWYEQGVAVMSVEEMRWHKCQYKTIALLANTMAKQQARDSGNFEAIFVSSEGEVHEGSSSNVFLVKHGRVLTPRLSAYILPGITRQFILDFCPSIGIDAAEGIVMMEDMRQADEVFVTSTSREVVPVVTLDGRKIADGSVGGTTRRILEHFRSLRTRAIRERGSL